jgi:hypothetical protein
VRRERVRDRADGVLVLLEVLAGARERPGEREVAGVVAAAPDRPGEHARGDHPLLAPDQQLGRGTDQAVDAERPAARVAAGQPLQQPARVDLGLGAGVQVAGQHDLLDVALADALDRVGDGRRPGPRGVRAVAVRHGPGRRRRGAGLEGARQRRDDGADADGGQPPLVRPVPEHEARDDEDAAGLRRPGERERPERHRPGARQPDVVPDDGVPGQLAPGGTGAGEPVAARRRDACRLAPGHEALAAADPGERALPGQDLQQRAGVRDGDGTRDERHGGRSCCHRRSG